MTKTLENRALGFLGLCMRAGQVQSGQEACVSLVRSGGAAVVLMDAGASGNTRKRVGDACAAHNTPLHEVDAGALGASIGKPDRMVVALVAGDMGNSLARMLIEG